MTPRTQPTIVTCAHHFAMRAILTVCIAFPVSAQTFFGSIVGSIMDSSGASVPGAKVIVTNSGTNETRSVESDQSGNYQFLNLVPGTYKVDLEKTGFKHFTKDEILIALQASVRVDIQMQVGEVGQTVEVNATALALFRRRPRQSARRWRAAMSRTCRSMGGTSIIWSRLCPE